MRASVVLGKKSSPAWQPQIHGLPFGDEKVRRYRILCHNTAALLYRARQYDLAIPLFQRAIAYRAMPCEPYLWLAASLWATIKDPASVAPFLEQAARRYSYGGDPWEYFHCLPEVADLGPALTQQFAAVVHSAASPAR